MASLTPKWCIGVKANDRPSKRMSVHLFNHNLGVRDHAENTTNPAISLVVNNVIPFLIGPSQRAPKPLRLYHVGEGTWPCPFPVTGNGHGRVPKPKGEHLIWAWSLRCDINPSTLLTLGNKYFVELLSSSLLCDDITMNNLFLTIGSCFYWTSWPTSCLCGV